MCSPVSSPSATSSGAPLKSNVGGGGWCKSLSDCLILGPKVSRNIKLVQTPQYHHLQQVYIAYIFHANEFKIYIFVGSLHYIIWYMH